MIEEIIYTSAPRGLKPGSKGFCTVASSPGMASTLATLLESLSGYRHLYEPGTAESLRNPPVFSHLKARVGGRSLHILSRVADAGLDYSGRSNKIAHHVVLNSQSLPPAGPAAVQMDSTFHETAWSGEPRLLTSARRPTRIDSGPSVCSYWKEVSGDAGWGGVCAERFSRPGPAETWMIYPLGVDILHLLQESFALLPPSARWNATYTTFYTKLPPGVECRLRCAIDGTAEAEQLRKRYELNVLDLCRPLGQAPANKWTEAGRAGTQPKFDRQYAESVSASEPQPDSNADDDSCYEVDLADLATPLPPPLPGARIAHINLETKYSVSRRRAFTERRQAWLLTLAVILALSTFLGLAATAIPLVRSKIVAAWTIAAARIGNAPSDISTPASKAEGAKQLTKPESGDGSRPAQPPRTPQQLEQGGNATAQGASPATPDGIAPNSPGSADSSEHPRLGGDSNESPPPQQSTGAVGESLAGEKVQSDAVSTSPPETRPVKAPEEHRPKLITRFRPLKPDGSLGGIQNVTLTFNEPIQPATMTWSVFYPPSSSKSTIEIDHVDSQVVLVSKQRGNDTRIAKVSASRDGAVFVFMPKVFIQRNELSDPEWVRQFRSSLIEFRAASAERELRYLVSFHRPQKFDPITIPTSKEDASPNYSKKHYTLLWCIGFAQPQLRIYINSKLKHRSVPLSPDAASPSVVDLRPISRCLTLRLSASLSTDDDPGKRESLDLELVPVGPQGDLTFQELKAWYKGVSSFFRSATKGIKEGRKSISAADDYIRSSLNNKNVKKKAELEALRAKLEQLKLDYERVPTDLDADELFRELEQLRIDYQLVYAVHTSSNAPVSSAEKLVLYGSTRDIDQRIVEVDQ